MTQLFVLDNSVTMRWCFENSANDYADAVLRYMTNNGMAIVPILWHYEVIAVLSKAQRLGSITAYKVENFLSDLGIFSVATDWEGGQRIFSEVRNIAVAYSLTGYDAAYLELALRKAIPLATLDEELQKAARVAGVELLQP